MQMRGEGVTCECEDDERKMKGEMTRATRTIGVGEDKHKESKMLTRRNELRIYPVMSQPPHSPTRCHFPFPSFPYPRMATSPPIPTHPDSSVVLSSPSSNSSASLVRWFLLKGPAHPMNDVSKTSTRVVGRGRLDWRFHVRMRSWNDGEMEDVGVGGIAYELG